MTLYTAGAISALASVLLMVEAHRYGGRVGFLIALPLCIFFGGMIGVGMARKSAPVARETK